MVYIIISIVLALIAIGCLKSKFSEGVIPICVFGNYSAGKSTFINALIGREVLPSGGDPVTAKIYKIKTTF